MNDELNVLILLSQEIKKMIERILAKKNMLIIKNGIVKKVDGNIYTVSIEQEEYLIKSQFKIKNNVIYFFSITVYLG